MQLVNNGEMQEQADMDEGLEESRRMLNDYYGAGEASANTDNNPELP